MSAAAGTTLDVRPFDECSQRSETERFPGGAPGRHCVNRDLANNLSENDSFIVQQFHTTSDSRGWREVVRTVRRILIMKRRMRKSEGQGGEGTREERERAVIVYWLRRWRWEQINFRVDCVPASSQARMNTRTRQTPGGRNGCRLSHLTRP